jgi:hypothetical protein
VAKTPCTGERVNTHACIIKDLNNASLTEATSAKITWQIQKNHQNNQAIMLVVDMANPAMCPVRSRMQMVLQAC